MLTTGAAQDLLLQKNQELSREIERLKRADAARRLEYALASPMDPVLLISRDMKLTAVNSVGLEAWGLDSTDVAGREADPYIGPVIPDTDYQAMFADCLDGWQQRYSGWFDIPGRGRGYREVHMRPFFETDGSISGVVATSRDRTISRSAANALRGYEERFRELFEKAPIGLAQISPQGRLISANSALARILGYPGSEDMLTECADATASLLANPGDWRRLKRLFGEHEGVADAEVRVKRKSGELKWVDVHLRIVHNESGGLLCYDIFVTDAERRKKAESALEFSVSEAKRASMAKSNFLANMSHEVRTPLSGIIGLTELTLDSELTADQRTNLEMIHESGRALLGVLNDVLDLSKIEAGKFELAEEQFDVTEIVESCLKIFAKPAKKRGLDLMLEIGAGLPSRLIGDPGRLRQVLVNLLNNAVKFTSRGHVKLSVKAEGEAGQGARRISFSVSDTGCGISEELQKSVFEIFFQAGRSFDCDSRGSGLGLAISRNLVDLMGGELTLESREGHGSTFSFSALFKEPVTFGVTGKAETSARNVPGLNILVVEDDETNAVFVVRMLEKHGHTAEHARNGLEALEKLSARGYDCVLMDIQMPEMDGMEATRRIRNGEKGIDARVPIIALTAHAMRGDKDTFIAAGMDEYVSKPIDTDELLFAVADTVRRDMDQ